MTKLQLSVFRSNKYIYGQIKDENGKTLVCANDKLLKNTSKMTKTQKAKEVGKLLAEKAAQKKLEKVVFDRRRFKYHGRVKALAEGAREGGLKF